MNEAAYREAEQELWNSVGRTPEERWIRPAITGTRVRVQEVGEGPVVLFIHGGPNAGSTWAPMVEHFPGHRCLLVDRPGTGLSEPFELGPENLRTFGARFASDVLDALGVDRAHLVASSFGGMLALYAAAETPLRFDRMVQMACPAFAPGMLTPPFLRVISITFMRRLMGALPPSPRANDAILRQIGHGASLDAGKIPQIFSDWYLALGEHTDTMKNDGDMIGRAASVFGFDTSLTIPDTTLGAVTIPTLFLWGEDDGFGGEEVARDLVSRMPHAELTMLPDAGHLPWLDEPAAIATATARFLADGSTTT